MPRYAFVCPQCQESFDARRPVEERDQAPCPACGGTAARQFTPRAVFVQTPAHLQHTRSFFQPPSTATHSSDYLEQKVLEDHVNGMHAAQEQARKNAPPPFEDYFWSRNKDLDPTRPLTKQEHAEVKTALGATTHA